MIYNNGQLSDRAQSLLDDVEALSSGNCMVTTNGILQLESTAIFYYKQACVTYWKSRIKKGANSGITNRIKTKLEWWTAPILCGAVRTAMNHNAANRFPNTQIFRDGGMQLLYWQLHFSMKRIYTTAVLCDIVEIYQKHGMSIGKRCVSTWAEHQDKTFGRVKIDVLNSVQRISEVKVTPYIPTWSQQPQFAAV